MKIIKKSTKYLLLFFFMVIVVFAGTAITTDFFNYNSEITAYAYTITTADVDYISVSGGIEITNYKGTATDVTIPETLDGQKVVALGMDAFKNKTTVQYINIPKTVVRIGSYIDLNTFSNCTSLIEINVAVENEYYLSDAGVLYSQSKGIPITLIKYPIKKTGAAYTLKDGTNYISYDGFMNNTNITSITNSTQLIGIGNEAFVGCTALTSFTIPTNLFEINQTTFAKSGIATDTDVVNKIIYRGKWVVGNTGTIGGVANLRADTVGIAAGALSNCGITGVSGWDNVKTIGSFAFAANSNFKVINIPASVVNIGGNAFVSCGIGATGNTLTFNGTGLKQISDFAFQWTKFTSVTIPNSVTSIGQYAFADNPYLTSITLPNTLERINNNTFYNCTSLASITIPSTVKSIGENAYYNTAAFNTVTNNVVNINNWIVGYRGTVPASPTFTSVIGFCDKALYNCNSMTTASLPATVKYLGESAFENCTALTSITMPGVVSIGWYAFKNTGIYNSAPSNSVVYADKWIINYKGTITTPTLNANIEGIASGAFAGSGLTSLTLPEGLLYINDNAFYNCKVLTDLIISTTVSVIGNYAFVMCYNLNNVYILKTTVPTAGKGLFLSSPITTIKNYVRNSCIDAFKVATNWSDYSSTFVVGYFIGSVSIGAGGLSGTGTTNVTFRNEGDLNTTNISDIVNNAWNTSMNNSNTSGPTFINPTSISIGAIGAGPTMNPVNVAIIPYANGDFTPTASLAASDPVYTPVSLSDLLAPAITPDATGTIATVSTLNSTYNAPSPETAVNADSGSTVVLSSFDAKEPVEAYAWKNPVTELGWTSIPYVNMHYNCGWDGLNRADEWTINQSGYIDNMIVDHDGREVRINFDTNGNDMHLIMPIGKQIHFDGDDQSYIHVNGGGRVFIYLMGSNRIILDNGDIMGDTSQSTVPKLFFIGIGGNNILWINKTQSRIAVYMPNGKKTTESITSFGYTDEYFGEEYYQPYGINNGYYGRTAANTRSNIVTFISNNATGEFVFLVVSDIVHFNGDNSSSLYTFKNGGFPANITFNGVSHQVEYYFKKPDTANEYFNWTNVGTIYN